jgi:FMN-dependent oxidoreductase (nitrilotriacetate monooxygenase family)
MAHRPGQFHLNAFLMPAGHHEAAWRLPDSDPFAHTEVDYYRNLAQIAERGKLDSLFLADSPVLWHTIARRPAGALEPTVLLAALAGVTQRIGLIATASTTYNEPYNLARRFGSLDFISRGRAGWNVVTTAGAEAARNFNLDELPAHRERYERAAEFMEVALKLWDSWSEDAASGDKESGVWGADEKLFPPQHRGRFFKVAGALNLPRSPQGYPLIVQAGSSDDGKELAARYAEAVFTAQQTLEDGQQFYAELKAQTRAAGRDPNSIKILPGIVPVIGSTEAEALALDAELERLIKPEYARQQLAQTLRVPPETLELDRELPHELLPEAEIEGAKSRYTLIVNLARRERLTVRQLIARLGGGRGHRTFTGTPEQVADALELWWDNGAADGFNVMPAVFPSGLARFVDHVVPLLQKRGLFRSEYTGETLRDHYGLARPHNANVARRGFSAVPSLATSAALGT